MMRCNTSTRTSVLWACTCSPMTSRCRTTWWKTPCRGAFAWMIVSFVAECRSIHLNLNPATNLIHHSGQNTKRTQQHTNFNKKNRNLRKRGWVFQSEDPDPIRLYQKSVNQVSGLDPWKLVPRGGRSRPSVACDELPFHLPHDVKLWTNNAFVIAVIKRIGHKLFLPLNGVKP